MNLNNSFTFTKSNSFTNSNTHTYTIASTNTNTHTNNPYKETLAEKAFARNRCQNFVGQKSNLFQVDVIQQNESINSPRLVMPAGEKPLMRRYFMREKGIVIIVNCKRCGVKMAKWKRSAEDEAEHPFPFDSICGRCITQKEVSKAYPLSRGTYLKK